MTDDAYITRSIIKITTSQRETKEVQVIGESPVGLYVNGQEWITFMCTPHEQTHLAVGYLYNGGVVTKKEDIAILELCENGHNVDLWLNYSPAKPEKWFRTSGCTGGFVFQQPGEGLGRVSDEVRLSSEKIFYYMSKIFHFQEIYRQSGGVHISALCDEHEIVITSEDIGRHNTLDKLAGNYLLNGYNLPHKIILSSGRISSEMIQKAIRIGAEIAISRTSPSGLAVKLAEDWGVTLIGYANKSRFHIYSHPHRILPSE